MCTDGKQPLNLSNVHARVYLQERAMGKILARLGKVENATHIEADTLVHEKCWSQIGQSRESHPE